MSWITSSHIEGGWFRELRRDPAAVVAAIGGPAGRDHCGDADPPAAGSHL